MGFPPRSPHLIRGGLVVLDPDTGKAVRVIALQYNPDTLTRTLQIKGAGGDSGEYSEAIRLKGPPVETLKLDAEIDATDQLESGDSTAGTLGLHTQLAVLETLVYPASALLQANNAAASAGNLEIAPMQSGLLVFVWSKQRVLPVRLTEFSITEESFDAALNPIRAKVSLSMRVLTVDDVGFEHKGGSLFMSYLSAKEQHASKAGNAALGSLGISGI